MSAVQAIIDSVLEGATGPFEPKTVYLPTAEYLELFREVAGKSDRARPQPEDMGGGAWFFPRGTDAVTIVTRLGCIWVRVDAMRPRDWPRMDH